MSHEMIPLLFPLVNAATHGLKVAFSRRLSPALLPLVNLALGILGAFLAHLSGFGPEHGIADVLRDGTALGGASTIAYEVGERTQRYRR